MYIKSEKCIKFQEKVKNGDLKFDIRDMNSKKRM